MSWTLIIPLILSSSVIVGLVELAKVGVGKWRPRKAVEDDRNARTFTEMHHVAEAYKEVVEVHRAAADKATETLLLVTAELEDTRQEVARLTLEVKTLETSLIAASETISQLMALVVTTG